ncbi:hypothetical protein [Motilibacter deserti]|uniref:Uncharacterized protein n=1 Tax=Motilibacter deserti TaxID=2714956 RepID=A0ABX0GY44_9ACTN|nr:hypothetical protein [Motilibacter deserti]NHC15036.1 hypothetical protein [Motilibacter deserti]
MTNLESATSAIVLGTDGRGGEDQWRALLSEDTAHVDLGDPDQVFLVHVVAVPRARVPVEGSTVEFEGLELRLVSVAVDNFVTLELEGVGPLAAERRSAYEAEWRAWTETGAQTGEAPPSWPAEVLAQVPLTVNDDRGTQYQLNSGEAGGTGTPWRYLARFRPAPPSTVRELVVSVAGFEHRLTWTPDAF